ncbi:MAG: asparagine synthase (glutamine-hydrolyzing) [Hyphomicrobiaceae bacterium]|nr:asparagine synthase (glutamine-hydrolyzing) [Hyphomicrobiaceae bacterium]
MCGIAGLVDWRGAPDPHLLAGMVRALHHRGPDAEGVLIDGAVGLGHARLSILDTTSANDQPFSDPSGALTIVFNGEIYNFRDLRRQLEGQGARFKTTGDTEVLLEAYRYWGPDCLERLDGMFAFCILDRPRRRLFLARDRFGEKPLHYAQPSPHELVFASEPRAVAMHPGLGAHVDPAALGVYLQLNYTLGAQTLFSGIKRLEPGHAMLVEDGGTPRIWRYFDLAANFRSQREAVSLEQASDRLREMLDAAVTACEVSDVPLGAFLSGGLDSACIVAAMARTREPGQVKTFSVGFAERTYSEIDQARETAAAIGVDHRDEIIHAGRGEILEALVRGADEPLADTSMLPTYFLCRFARRHVKVALSGDGGDEVFGGYETYAADRLHGMLSVLPKGVWPLLGRGVAQWMPVSRDRVSLDYKVRQFLAGMPLPADRAHYSWREIFSQVERAKVLRPDFAEVAILAKADAFDEFARHFDEVRDCDPLDQAMYVDMKTWMPDDILVKVDRTSMANSLEVRAPFLDHRLVAFAASLPVHMKLRRGEKKRVLRHSQRPRLPPAVFQRKKQGFNAPISHWLDGDLYDLARQTTTSAAISQWLDRRRVDELWTEHRTGRRDNGLKLFGLLCLGLWLDPTRSRTVDPIERGVPAMQAPPVSATSGPP